MENKDNNKLSCTFCGKGQEDVRKLIAGPSVYICDVCVDLCIVMIEEEVKAEEPAVEEIKAEESAAEEASAKENDKSEEQTSEDESKDESE